MITTYASETRMMKLKKVIYAAVFLLVLVGCLTFSGNLSYAIEINDIKLTKEKLPRTWQLVDEVSVSKEELPIFERRFGLAIKEIVNQTFSVDGETIQINYSQPAVKEEANQLYQKLFIMVGGSNDVLRKEEIAIEIISQDSRLRSKAIELFIPGDIHKEKLKIETLPENWKLIKELIVADVDLPQFERLYVAKVKGVINQIFNVEGSRIQINYVLAEDESGANKIYQKINELVGASNTVIKRGKTTIEIISPYTKLTNQVLGFLLK